VKLGLVDIAAAGVALFAILLPPRTQPIDPLYVGRDAGDTQRAIAAYQADIAKRPDDPVAAQRLVETLIDAGQSDWAMRAAGAAVERAAAAEKWRVLLAVSEVHADRLEIKEAHDWAAKAVGACGEPGATCAVHERVRLETYAQVLKAGVDSGIDPKLDPEGFRAAVSGAMKIVKTKPSRDQRGPKKDLKK
jgi:hypothetical protein